MEKIPTVMNLELHHNRIMVSEKRYLEEKKITKDYESQQLNIISDDEFVLLSKANYKAKDGTIKRGIEIDNKYYAPFIDIY